MTSSCSAAAISAACQSSGGTQGVANGPASSPGARAVYLKAPQTGTGHFAVDSPGGTGAFTATLEPFSAPTNGRCANARKIQLINGRGSAHGDIYSAFTPDEFPTVQCGRSTLDGPQAYYAVTLQAGKSYGIALTNKSVQGWLSNGMYGYVFGSSCTATAINRDCSSGGTTGAAFSGTSSGRTEWLKFSPSTSGTYHIAVDTPGADYSGGFRVDVVEYTPPANDKCPNAQLITVTSAKATVSGFTLGATNSQSRCGYYGNVYGPDLFYKVDGVAGKTYKVTFKPDGSSQLLVNTGGCDYNSMLYSCTRSGAISGGITYTTTASDGDLLSVEGSTTSPSKFTIEVAPLP